MHPDLAVAAGGGDVVGGAGVLRGELGEGVVAGRHGRCCGWVVVGGDCDFVGYGL